MPNIDPAAIMAAHSGVHQCKGWMHRPEQPTWNPLTGGEGPLTGPCDLYRLAEALRDCKRDLRALGVEYDRKAGELRDCERDLAAERATVQRVEALADRATDEPGRAEDEAGEAADQPQGSDR